MNFETAGNGHENARQPPTTELLHGRVTKGLIESFYATYNNLDFGFLENVYRGALTLELQERGFRVTREVSVPILYKGIQVALYRMDFIVDDCVVVEVKSAASLGPNDQRQLLNYLRATSLEVGLLLHFGPKPKFYRLVSPNAQ